MCRSKHVSIPHVTVGVMVTPCDRLRACRYYVASGYATGSESRRMRYYAASFTSPGAQSATPMQRVSGITRHCADIVPRPAMLQVAAFLACLVAEGWALSRVRWATLMQVV